MIISSILTRMMAEWTAVWRPVVVAGTDCPPPQVVVEISHMDEELRSVGVVAGLRIDESVSWSAVTSKTYTGDLRAFVGPHQAMDSTAAMLQDVAVLSGLEVSFLTPILASYIQGIAEDGSGRDLKEVCFQVRILTMVFRDDHGDQPFTRWYQWVPLSPATLSPESWHDPSSSPPPPMVIGEEEEDQEDSSEEAGEELCTVCMDKLRPTRALRYFPPSITSLKTCGHKFHSACIRQWLHTAKSCPVCRSSIPNKQAS